MPYRAWFKQLSGPFNPTTPGKRFSSGISQSVNASPDVTEARSDHFPCTSQVLNPGVPFSTRNPRTLSSSPLAHTTATSAIEPLVIHIFSPLRIYLLAFFTARVSIPPGFDPNCGSVKPKQPIAFPCCKSGSHLFFCASLPYERIGYITSAPCTETKLRNPESPRSSSCVINPYATLDIPAQPYPCRFAPKNPNSPSCGTRCFGKTPSRFCFSMIGMISFSTNPRAVWRTSFSSSFNCESKSIKSTPPYLAILGSLRSAPVQCSNAPDSPSTAARLTRRPASSDTFVLSQNRLQNEGPCRKNLWRPQSGRRAAIKRSQRNRKS